MNRPRRLDLHVHSVHSPDGHATIDELVARARPAGLDGFALTDHNTLQGHARLAELARAHPDLTLLPAVEVSTRDGHLLVYGLAELPPLGQPLLATVEWVIARGGIPVPSHPFRRVHGVGGAQARTLPVPALETINGHNGAWGNARAAEVAASRNLASTGGSDAHRVVELGRSWTEFPASAATPELLLASLRDRNTRAGGRSATLEERSLTALRSFALRVRRGFRPI